MVILLVDDDLSVQLFTWKLLRSYGFTVLTAGNGTNAMEASRNHPGTIDLLFTDIDMPGISGLELSKQIAVERPDIKVLIMTGGGTEPERLEGLAVLQKPFTDAALR